MKYLFQSFILILISSIFPKGVYSHIFDDSILRSRPSMDTFMVSQSGKFHIHYDLSGLDSPILDDINLNGFPDYIEEVGIAADYVDSILVDVMNFLPVNQDDDGVYDIYVEDLGLGYYGVNNLDFNSLGEHTGSSYIKIDNKYEEGDYYTSGLDAMKVTVAHEYFHAIQRSYQLQFTTESLFFFEMSSTWIEDIIYPNVNDYIDSGWLSTFYNNPDKDIRETDGYSIALYAHFLSSIIDQDNSYENSIIKKIWEDFSITNNAFSSLNNILSSPDYSTTFIETWLIFLTRNLFNGKYDDMENDFYYYEDQIYAMPITTTNSQNLDGPISDIIFLNNESISLSTFEPFPNFFINISDLNENFVQSIILENNQGYPSLYSYSIENSDYFHVGDDISKIHLNIGSETENQFELFLDVLKYDYGDINQNNFINVVDIICVINYIFNDLVLNDFQIILSDLNIDDNIDILDVIEIVNIITE